MGGTTSGRVPMIFVWRAGWDWPWHITFEVFDSILFLRYEYFSDCSVFTADQEAFFWNTEPDNWTYEYYYGENCMAVDPRWVNPDDGGLRDQGCKYELSYVCQKYQWAERM